VFEHDPVWNVFSGSYLYQSTAAVLTVHIAMINLWNRINVPTPQVAGEWIKSAEAAKCDRPRYFCTTVSVSFRPNLA
jgi:hypothetical protein